jgi:hypothetical protein
MPYPSLIRPMNDAGGYNPGGLKLPQMNQTTGMPPMNQATTFPAGYGAGQTPGAFGGGGNGPATSPFSPGDENFGSHNWTPPVGVQGLGGGGSGYGGASDPFAHYGAANTGNTANPYATNGGEGMGNGYTPTGAAPAAPAFGTSAYWAQHGNPNVGAQMAQGTAPDPTMMGGGSNVNGPGFDGDAAHSAWLGQQQGGGMGGGASGVGFGQMPTNPGGSGQTQSNPNPYMSGPSGTMTASGGDSGIVPGMGHGAPMPDWGAPPGQQGTQQQQAPSGAFSFGGTAPHASTSQPWGGGPYPGSGGSPMGGGMPQVQQPQAGPAGAYQGAAWSPGMGSSAGGWGAASSSAAGQMNPALGAQLRSLQQQGNQNLMQNIMPQINSAAGAVGGIGGSRQGIAQGTAMAQSQGNIAAAQAQAMLQANEGAQNRALGAYQGDQQQGLGMLNSDRNFAQGQGQLGLGYQQAGNQWGLGQGQLGLGYHSADQQYGLGMTNAGNTRYGMDLNNQLGYSSLGNQYGIASMGNDTSRYGMGLNYGLGMTNAGNQRYGIDQATNLGYFNGGNSFALGMTNAGNQANANDQNFYTQQRGQDLQSLQVGAGLMQGANQGEWQPYQNAGQVYAPYTGYGSNTQSQQGGGVVGALGGALGGYQIGSMFGGGFAPPVGMGSNPYGYNGTMNNPSAYVGPP